MNTVTAKPMDGTRSLGRRSSGTYSSFKSASTKPPVVMMSRQFAVSNDS